MSDIFICDTSFYEGEVIKVLKKYLPDYGFKFTVESNFADVLFSINGFPNVEKYCHIPKIKQANAISDFHQMGLKNYFIYDKSNSSVRSLIPNKIITDSHAMLDEVSSNKILQLSKEFGYYTPKGEVIKYWPDPEIFYPSQFNKAKEPKNWVAVTHYGWKSLESRPEAIIRFAEFIEGTITIIGEMPQKYLTQLPSNCKIQTDTTDFSVAKAMREADACVCFDYDLLYVSFLVKALACGLPILLGETITKFDTDYLPYIYNYALNSQTYIAYFNLNDMPDYEIEKSLIEMCEKYTIIREALMQIDSYGNLHQMLFEYGNIFKASIERKKSRLHEYSY